MWGANGGDARSGTGGKGSYSKGTLTVTTPTTYYIYVGGKGSTVTASTPGGWNGGGSCLGSHSSGNNGGTGGGGTDIRTMQNTTYADRIMVAGGGGGAVGYYTFTGDGHVVITNSLMATSEVGVKNSISVNPNPTIDYLNVSKISSKANYKIYTLSGQLLQSGAIADKTIDVRNLNNGAYIIDLQDSTVNARMKFIKK